MRKTTADISFHWLSIFIVASLVGLAACSSALWLSVAASNSAVDGQAQSANKYSRCSSVRPRQHANVRVTNHVVTITAFGPIPLLEAVEAVNRRYGWSVNFEEPVSTSPFEACEEDGTLQFSGTVFRTAFAEPDNARSLLPQEDAILDKIVSDYNETANPGNFVVRKGSYEDFTVVPQYVRNEQGKLVKFIPVLDSHVSIPLQTERVYEFIRQIAQQVSGAGIAVQVAAATGYPSNANDTSTFGGSDVAAQAVLDRSLELGGMRISWSLVDCSSRINSNSSSCVLEFLPKDAVPSGILTGTVTTTRYTDAAYGVSIVYPTTYDVTSGAPPIATVFSVLSPQNVGNRSLVTIAMPPGAYPDSDLTSAFINIGVNTNLTKQQCQRLPIQSSNPQGPPAEPRALQLNGVRFRGEESSGLAGGTGYTETSYTAYEQGVCYELSLVTAVSTALLQDPIGGDVTLGVDLKDVWRRLNSIISTIKVVDRNGGWRR